MLPLAFIENIDNTTVGQGLFCTDQNRADKHSDYTAKERRDIAKDHPGTLKILVVHNITY